MKSWILATRPKTLTAALVPIIVGSSLAYVETRSFHWWISVLALFASFFIQIGTNLVNDAVDYMKGADTERRIGPQRVTQAGIFTPRQVVAMATFCFALAVLCGVPIALKGGLPMIMIGVASVALGYGYTAGPFPLAYLGLGDFFVVLFFGLIAVGGVYFLHSELLSTGALIAGLQVGLHCAVLIAINNLRDVEGDRQVQKKTWPVRFGKRFARIEISFLCLAPFLLGVYWALNGHWLAFVLPSLVLPLAYRIATSIWKTEPSPAYNRYLGMAAGLHLIFGLLLSVGLFL